MQIADVHAASAGVVPVARRARQRFTSSQLGRLYAALMRRLWHRKELRIYMVTAEQVAHLPHPVNCRRDHWEALQFCTAWSYEHMSRGEYLGVLDARRRSGQQHLYSIVEGDILVHYGWLMSRQERAPDPAVGLVFVPPPGSAALWDYFTHPKARGRGLYRETLWQCLHDAVEIDGARQVFIYVYADNPVSQHVIERAGFAYMGSLVSETRLLRTRRYAVTAGAPIDVRVLADDTPAPVVAA